jgi:hypothetical protein
MVFVCISVKSSKLCKHVAHCNGLASARGQCELLLLLMYMMMLLQLCIRVVQLLYHATIVALLLLRSAVSVVAVDANLS